MVISKRVGIVFPDLKKYKYINNANTTLEATRNQTWVGEVAVRHFHECLRSAFHSLNGSRLRKFELQLAFTHVEIREGLRILLNVLV